MRDGRPLRKCPSCRQPIGSPENAFNDLTMIDYLERKRQRRRERKQKDRKAKLRDFLETASQELVRTEAALDERKQSNLQLAKEKLDIFAAHAKYVFSEALVQQSENEEVVSKMASANTRELNDRNQRLQEYMALVTSLLEQSYINQEAFDGCGKVLKAMQYKTLPFKDPSVRLWDIYRKCLLKQFTDASKIGPSTNREDILNTTPSKPGYG